MRLLSAMLLVTISLGEILSASATSLNPCSAGALVHSPNDKCECRRHNGVMGRFRSGCSATWDEGACVPLCDAPSPKEQLALETEKCPVGMRACPVGPLEYECVSPDLDVDNCGGCASTGEGVACGDYPGVRGAACVEGVCEVYSCDRYHGYTLLDGECRTRAKGMGGSRAGSH